MTILKTNYNNIWLISAIDHGKSDELGSGPNWKKIARFKKLENSSLYFQNDLAFLGRIGKPSLSEFPEIYVSAYYIASPKHYSDTKVLYYRCSL
jgi:hypothetical protein